MSELGSGAGGGPLAARLAEAGKRVLLLEAGQDPIDKKSHEFPDAEPRLVMYLHRVGEGEVLYLTLEMMTRIGLKKFEGQY